MKKTFLNKGLYNDARQCHDTLFGAICLKQPNKRFASLPTKLCQEFCKGITYFQYDMPFPDHPFYHRDNSCGTKKVEAFAKFKDSASKEYLKTCYIERLVYDAIYINTFYEQDIGHKHELKLMEQLYQKYYDHATITVSLTYERLIYPISLMIFYRTAHGIISESFTKQKRTKHVLCRRDEKGQIYEKVQSFDQESGWMVGGKPVKTLPF